MNGLGGLGCTSRSRQPDRRTEQQLRSLDQVELNAVSDYKFKGWTGTEWVKLTYDTGVASNALPLAMDPQTTALEKKGEFVAANGGKLDHYQRFKYPAWDEQGYRRDFSGWLTNVNKPLLAAGEVSKVMHAYVHENGGVLMERNGKICQGMRKEFDRLRWLHGDKELMPLCKEHGTYHVWVQADQAKAYSLHGLNQPYMHEYMGNGRQGVNP